MMLLIEARFKVQKLFTAKTKKYITYSYTNIRLGYWKYIIFFFYRMDHGAPGM